MVVQYWIMRKQHSAHVYIMLNLVALRSLKGPMHLKALNHPNHPYHLSLMANALPSINNSKVTRPFA